jgi:hypothetical protein
MTCLDLLIIIPIVSLPVFFYAYFKKRGIPSLLENWNFDLFKTVCLFSLFYLVYILFAFFFFEPTLFKVKQFSIMNKTIVMTLIISVCTFMSYKLLF